ncbi:isocitrate/isopropylmalate dehydrogenase family protein [Marinagarivorans algicola]|uniref:isocitrate/isopropylmalate dehydrogenase family protein n=1 Tax=Marinagarivorans algicola TaxID=1513270 RepID=UPI0006B54B72|nr:isocitrate/isopropylmalate family dehydrogenase [Marinagarivorans algicola]
MNQKYRSQGKRCRAFNIAVLAGDGIGTEIMPPCLRLIDRVLATVNSNVTLNYTALDAGAGAYQATGCALSDNVLAVCKTADAILLGAMGLPQVRYPDGTEVSPQIELREKLQLFAGVRPIKVISGLGGSILSHPKARNIDFVLIRESTEGLFAGRAETQFEYAAVAHVSHGMSCVGAVDYSVVERASDTMIMTQAGVKRVCDFAFNIAHHRKTLGARGLLTCIDKSNVLGSMAFFRHHFLECARINPDIQAETLYVDAAAQKMVMTPWHFDVVVTENMFGDILSELGAGLIGGVGFAPSADIGEQHAVFQPCHGSAPDIVGQGIANPVGMILSAAMMLQWLAERYSYPDLYAASVRLEAAVNDAFVSGHLIPVSLGGTATMQDIYSAISAKLGTSAP